MNQLVKALNDPIRREIVELLKEGDRTAGEIADHFDVSKPTISHHLDLLKQAGLVAGIRKGQFIYYSLNASILEELLAWIMKITK